MNKNIHFPLPHCLPYCLRKIRYSEKKTYSNYLLRICNYCRFNAKKNPKFHESKKFT